MTDPRGLEPEAQPRVKTDQETHPPRRYEDPDLEVENEKRFGMSMWLGIFVIAVIFVIAFLWIYL